MAARESGKWVGDVHSITIRERPAERLDLLTIVCQYGTLSVYTFTVEYYMNVEDRSSLWGEDDEVSSGRKSPEWNTGGDLWIAAVHAKSIVIG